jgi:hypothetical protein
MSSTGRSLRIPLERRTSLTLFLLATKNATSTLCGAPIRNKTPIFANVTIILGVIAGVVVVLRIGSKIGLGLGLAPDDYAILVTLACGIPSSVMNVRGTGGNGEGKDIWTLPFDMITRFGVYFYTLEILYFAQVMLLKMTLLLFYLQIFPGPARRLLWATVVVNGIFGVSFMLLATFQCTPISFFWTNWDGEHKGKWYVGALLSFPQHFESSWLMEKQSQQ